MEFIAILQNWKLSRVNICCQKEYLWTETKNIRQKPLIDLNSEAIAKIILLWMCREARGRKPMTINIRLKCDEQQIVYRLCVCTV